MDSNKVIEILDEAKAPLYMFEEIMKWAKDANENGFNFEHVVTNRDSVIKQLQQSLNIHQCKPVVKKIVLPYSNNTEVDVVTFDFTEMITTLLTDDYLISDIDNFDVDPLNPFGKYKNIQNILSVVNSGTWYNNAYKYCIKD